MNYLLDTWVIYELIKPKPSSKVIKWLRSCQDEALFLNSLTIGEIQKGISKLPNSQKRKNLQAWIDGELIRRFDKRILGIDIKVAQKWGEIQAFSKRAGTNKELITKARRDENSKRRKYKFRVFKISYFRDRNAS